MSKTTLATARSLTAIAAVSVLALAGCNGVSQTQTRGYIFSESSIEQIPPGSSQEQVLVVLGSPSTVATLDGDVFYYISQKTVRPVAFLNPSIVDQEVLAVYFNKQRKVERVAKYGLKDGIVFDFVSRTTPTSGVETTFLQRALGSLSF